jgi:hypothetical protein
MLKNLDRKDKEYNDLKKESISIETFIPQYRIMMKEYPECNAE